MANIALEKDGTPGEIRTRNLRLRRTVLCPVELRTHVDWRAVGDSNPAGARRHSCFRDRCNKPLCQPPAVVLEAGFEPARPVGHCGLSAARLPVPVTPAVCGDGGGIRTRTLFRALRPQRSMSSSSDHPATGTEGGTRTHTPFRTLRSKRSMSSNSDHLGMVPKERLELSRPCGHCGLSTACLPFPTTWATPIITDEKWRTWRDSNPQLPV